MSKKCINCGAELHEEASFCHGCESTQVERKPFAVPRRRKRKGFILFAVLLAAAAVCFIGIGFGEHKGQLAQEEPSVRTTPVPGPTESSGPKSSQSPVEEPSQPSVPEPSDSPTPEAPEASRTEPVIVYLSDYQADYSDADGELRVFATFFEEDVVDDGDDYFTTRIGQSEEYYKRVYLFARQRDTGELAKQVFLSRIQSACVEVYDGETGEHLETVSAVECEEFDAVLDARVAFTSDSGTLKLVWHVVLKNSSELVFRQTMEIFKKDRLVYTPENAAMNTMEELRALISQIEAQVDPATEVIIHLPAVRYEGELELNRAFSFYGSGIGSTKTTFTDTVSCRAPESSIIGFFEIGFEGDGQGTGIEDHCGVFLGGCTLRNWEIAAMTGETGWVVPAGCVLEENGIGIQYNCRRFWFNNNEFIDDYFVNNEIAIEINRMPRVQTLVFPNTRFIGNGEVVANHIGQPTDLSGAEID